MPEVILGSGSIPEGLAKVQLDVWDRTVQSLREDFEKIIETQIFKKVLEANGLQAHVEIVWTKPGERAKIDEIKNIIEILKLMDLDYNLRVGFEKRLSDLMQIEFKEEPVRERKNEEATRQPQVPGQNAKPPTQKEEVESCCELHENEEVPFIVCPNCKSTNIEYI